MSLFGTDDGLILTEEGASCRARAGSLNFLFRNSTEERVRKDYLRSRDIVRSRIEGRWKSNRMDIPSAEALEEMAQEITLHWMYYYIVNGFDVAVLRPISLTRRHDK